MGLCVKCSKRIKSTDIKLCSKCSNTYHYQCLGVPLDTFGKESKAFKASWKCSECITDKGGDTPSHSKAGAPHVDTSSPSTNTEDLKQYIEKKLEESLSRLLSDIRRDFTTENSNTRSIIQDLTESVNFMSDKYEKLQETLNSKIQLIEKQDVVITTLRSEVTDLKARVNLFEQQSRECNLELQCVPEHRSENLKSVIQQLFTTVGCDLTNHNLVNYHRVPKKNQESSRPRSIVVKLASPLIRDTVIAAVKTFNRTHQQDKLSTAHLGLGGDKKPVYVCEHLSPGNKLLHASARKVAKDKKFEFVWVRGGKVFMRKDINTKSFIVRDLDFLNSL